MADLLRFLTHVVGGTADFARPYMAALRSMVSAGCGPGPLASHPRIPLSSSLAMEVGYALFVCAFANAPEATDLLALLRNRALATVGCDSLVGVVPLCSALWSFMEER